MSAELIYWDSDAFLGWLQNEAGKAELCEGTIKRAETGEVLIVTSALTFGGSAMDERCAEDHPRKGRNTEALFPPIVHSGSQRHTAHS